MRELSDSWSDLQDAYGPADGVPRLLANLSSDSRNRAWDEAWARLCHQGKVYSASFAALPHLLSTATRFSPSQRPMILALASCICSGASDTVSIPDSRREYAPSIRAFEDLALETSRERGIPQSDYIYVLQAVLSFRGIHPWSSLLDRLGSEEFEATCPQCDAALFVAIGSRGCFTSVEDYAVTKDARTAPVSPRDTLPEPGAWLRATALAVGQVELADRMSHLFGVAECASCRCRFDLGARLEEENA